MQSIRGWIDDWNDIIRTIIFKDDILKYLMMLNEDVDIISFIDKYFIRAGYTNKLLENENVRIVYSDVQGKDTDVPNVKRNMITFDIYVKTEHLHNVGNDRLVMRTQLIANRLIELLTMKRYIGRYRFWIAGDWDLGTSAIDYARYSVAFYYMKVY